MKSPRANRFCRAAFALFLASAFASCGGGGGGGGGGNPPATPTGLAATPGNAQVTLTWNASTGATSYNLSRSTTNGGPYQVIATVANALLNVTDKQLTNGTTYYYVVNAANSFGTSANSAQVSATPALPNPPPVPTGLAATPTSGQVALTWNSSAGATSYKVSRSTTSGGPYASIATPATNTYTDSAVTNGTTYYYVVAAVNAAGSSANSGQVSATPALPNPPPTPTGLMATAGNQQVVLNWSASAGATSYKVGRSSTSGGPYTNIASPVTNTYTDVTVTNGTTYYYVVAASNAGGTSANSTQVSATPSGPSTAVTVTVDVLADRHFISPYVYGVNFPPSAAYITNANTTLVRWGGNASSTYNWKLGTDNADNDYFWEDFGFGALGNAADSDSAQFITDVKAAGSRPLMTMAMLNWVAQSPETAGASGNLHWTYSVSQDGACSSKTDPFNSDASVALKADCSTPFVASQAQLNRAYFPLLDDHTQACPSGNCVYRIDWVTDASKGLAQAFGSGSCPIPYFASTSCHFYNMDNEIDIWAGTHFDVHPNQTTYDELRDVFLTEGGNLKTWDPQAVRFGWVSCCWGPYWNPGPSGDRSSHANIDFMPWWINEVYWNDQINGSRTLDVLDLHAYPETSGNGLALSAQRVLALTDTHDWWDPTYTSQAWFGGVDATVEQPNDHMPFRIPRVRAIANMIYPGTPVGFTEWNFAMAGESDFSTALADADAYGILGRERATYSTRWTAPDPSTPAYNSLLLYRNFNNGSKGVFNPISVSATHNADPNLFSVYAATNPSGNSLMLMVVNKDPVNTNQVQFALSHFKPSQVTTYTLSQASPNSIVAGTSQGWPANSTVSAAPYSATLLVVTGSTPSVPAAEWDLNPDTIMVPAGGTVNLNPKWISGTGTVTLGSPSSQGGITVTTTGATVNSGQQGDVQVVAGNTPGFYSFSVPATDGSGVSTNESGWIVVGKPAATLAKTAGDSQTGTVGTVLPVALAVTLTPGSSGGMAGGASVFFTITSATGGSLTNVASGNGEKIFTGPKVIAVTNSSGVASVTLTLSPTAGAVTVHAEGPYGLGHPVIPTDFSETAH